jgi:hypothetical protein
MTTEDLEVMFEKNNKKVLSEIKETEKLVKKNVLDLSKYNIRYLKREECNTFLEEDNLDNIMLEFQGEKDKFSNDYIGLEQ